jgi:hypothetical protein
MPRIKWRDLPPELLRHLFDRAKEREISMDDLFALEEWRRHSPDAPEGRWFRDFGSFKLAGKASIQRPFC